MCQPYIESEHSLIYLYYNSACLSVRKECMRSKEVQ